MKIVSTINVEIFDSANVRIDYPSTDTSPVTVTLYVDEKNNDIYKILPETVDRSISIVNSDCEYLVIFTDNPISIKLNGSGDAITVTKQFVLMGTGINSLSVSNDSTTLSATITVVVGNVV